MKIHSRKLKKISDISKISTDPENCNRQENNDGAIMIYQRNPREHFIDGDLGIDVSGEEIFGKTFAKEENSYLIASIIEAMEPSEISLEDLIKDKLPYFSRKGGYVFLTNINFDMHYLILANRRSMKTKELVEWNSANHFNGNAYNDDNYLISIKNDIDIKIIYTMTNKRSENFALFAKKESMEVSYSPMALDSDKDYGRNDVENNKFCIQFEDWKNNPPVSQSNDQDDQYPDDCIGLKISFKPSVRIINQNYVKVFSIKKE